MKVKFLYLHRDIDGSEGDGNFREALLRAGGTMRSNKPENPSVTDPHTGCDGGSGGILRDNIHTLPFRSGLATLWMRKHR